jgi:hypothetical protein
MLVTTGRRNIALFYIFSAFLSILSGGLLGIGGAYLGALLGGMLLSVLAFAIPLGIIFWSLVLITFVIAGPVQYFGGLQKIFWLPYMLAFLFFFRVLLAKMFSRMPKQVAGHSQSAQTSPTRVFVGVNFLIFVSGLVVASLVNLSPILQVLLSLKEYFFIVGVGFALIWGLIPASYVDRLLHYLPWFMLIQFPVIVYQHYVIAANRVGSSPWDSVVGLMSGDPMGGGASATMALIVVIGMTYQLAAYKEGLTRLPKLIGVLLLGLVSIGLAEVKLAVLLIPVAFPLVYRREILRRPVFGLFFLTIIGAMSIGLLTAYKSQFADTRIAAGNSIGAYVEDVLKKNTGPDDVNKVTGEMGRVGAFRFWAGNHSLSDPVDLLLGHGIGAVRIGTVVGEVSQRYQFELARSTLVTLLWEGGLISAVAILLIFGTSAISALGRSQLPEDPDRKAAFTSAAIGLVLTVVMMPYGPDLIFVSQAQLIAVLLLGRVLAEPLPASLFRHR